MNSSNSKSNPPPRKNDTIAVASFDAKVKLFENEIQRLHLTELYTPEEISKALGGKLNRYQVYYYLKKNDIFQSHRSEKRKLQIFDKSLAPYKDQICHLYLDKSYSLEKIARELGGKVPTLQIRRWLVRNKLFDTSRPNWKRGQFLERMKPFERRIKTLYLDQQLSPPKISQELNAAVSESQVRLYLKIANIYDRKRDGLWAKRKFLERIEPFEKQIRKLHLEESFSPEKISESIDRKLSGEQIRAYLKQAGIFRSGSRLEMKKAAYFKRFEPYDKQIRYLYSEKCYTPDEISKALDRKLTLCQIKRYVKKIGIHQARGSEGFALQKLRRNIAPHEERIRQLYLEELFTVQEIEEALKGAVSLGQILKYLKLTKAYANERSDNWANSTRRKMILRRDGNRFLFDAFNEEQRMEKKARSRTCWSKHPAVAQWRTRSWVGRNYTTNTSKGLFGSKTQEKIKNVPKDAIKMPASSNYSKRVVVNVIRDELTGNDSEIGPETEIILNMCRGLMSVLSTKIPPIKKIIGCSPGRLRSHIESQFSNGMTWDNYGKAWNLDSARLKDVKDIRDASQILSAFYWESLRVRKMKDEAYSPFKSAPGRV